MEHKLPELPYAYDALEPFIDARTMEIHHTKHHQAYIANLNAALKGHDRLAAYEVEHLVANLDEIPEEIRAAVRNHGGGHANHSFFWPMLKKGVEPKGPVLDAINKDFGGYDAFKTTFSDAAAKRFGSGWAWLVVGSGGGLEIVSTANQDSPLSQGKKPVLGIDVWEHAYYLLYQNRRPDYIAAFYNVINWDRVNDNFVDARS
ncbi:superoxide dismutase, Fe-Mn family [Desulforhopalus singaporensis]|uniref:Superoxide dismutase n=2 Tax=Desulforhopalus singaporensis TaxID=91360 RepID=A0A1H0TCN2_9BACT|nr:superoxide dismutase [Desulforhopalus singaporensis]SDP51767.1 superoxide dismutase, Fe-Mn family [Desulforhopalus singaporensis]